MELPPVAIIAALLGAAGIGGVIREIVNAITLVRQGVSGKEDQRRVDIIAQRDFALEQAKEALAAAKDADEEADRERQSRIKHQEHAARLRRQLIDAGIEPLASPDSDAR